MPAFDWDEANTKHLERHRVTPKEAEEAILDPHSVLLDIQMIKMEERFRAAGMTATGRILTLVFTFRGEAIRPITARDADSKPREIYFAGRGA